MPYCISLAGEWFCKLDPARQGTAEGWQHGTEAEHAVLLPGTAQTNGIGPRSAVRQTSNLTPVTDYVGPAWYWHDIELSETDCREHAELFLERCCWQSFAWLNGVALGTRDSLVAPHVYDLTPAVRPGKNRLSVMVDNANVKAVGTASRTDGAECVDLVSLPDQRKRLNCGGHHTLFGGFAWNGITGRMAINIRPRLRIVAVQVYPRVAAKSVELKITCVNDFGVPHEAGLGVRVLQVPRLGESDDEFGDDYGLRSDCAEAPADSILETRDLKPETLRAMLTCPPGISAHTLSRSMGEEVRLWDEHTPELYGLEATLKVLGSEDRYVTEFGMRELSQVGTQLAINGRPTFLRGALEKFVHPLTGYPPTDMAYWLKIFAVSKAHGLNHVRFHTCCPPEATFAAADRLGMILNVELPGCSGGEPDDPDTQAFLNAEAMRILRTFGNHPSFCMLGMGNELLDNAESCAPAQKRLMARVARCREEDDRHWYCCTAHPHTEGRHDDFYISAWPRGASWEQAGEPLTGIRWSGFCVVDSSRFNTRPPETASDYRGGIAGIGKPVITHEVGQWAVYPDVREIGRYTGVMKPCNLEIIRDFMAEKGTLHLADDFVRASGELSLLLYKEEIESALRTPGLAGFQLLGFHDHPPQGTSTVGIVNALRESKGIVTPGEFRQFCSETVPLARMKKRTFTCYEEFTAVIDVAHAGPDDLRAAAFGWRLLTQAGDEIASGRFPDNDFRRGSLSRIGEIRVALDSEPAPAKARLTVFLEGTTITNGWDVWVYPEERTHPSRRARWARGWNSGLAEEIAAGATAVVELPAQQIPGATRGCFTTLFWNPIMKRNQKCFTMGILCDPEHPALAHFPTESHTNWQWWDMLRPSRVLDLDVLNPRPEPIVRMIDSFIGNRCLGVLVEARLGKGRLLLTSLDLSSQLDVRHAARQLRTSLEAYVVSRAFTPEIELDAVAIDSLIAAHREEPKQETRDEVKARFDRVGQEAQPIHCTHTKETRR